MVTQDDDSQTLESRPPTLDDLINLCRHLNQKGVRYIVIGGMAMIQQGFVRATEDIDLLVDASLENEMKIKEALRYLPDQAAGEINPGDLDQYQVIRVADEIVIDLMKTACGMEFRSASKSIQKVTFDGVEVPFANAEFLLKLKQSVRPKDKLDREFLLNMIKKKKC